MAERKFFREKRKTPNKDRDNKGPADYIPDRMPVLKSTITVDNKLKIDGGSIRPSQYEPEEPIEEHWVTRASIITVSPLVPLMKVKWGGGRSYGGGISPEAIRRAKRKTRRRGRPAEGF